MDGLDQSISYEGNLGFCLSSGNINHATVSYRHPLASPASQPTSPPPQSHLTLPPQPSSEWITVRWKKHNHGRQELKSQFQIQNKKEVNAEHLPSPPLGSSNQTSLCMDNQLISPVPFDKEGQLVKSLDPSTFTPHVTKNMDTNYVDSTLAPLSFNSALEKPKSFNFERGHLSSFPEILPIPYSLHPSPPLDQNSLFTDIGSFRKSLEGVNLNSLNSSATMSSPPPLHSDYERNDDNSDSKTFPACSTPNSQKISMKKKGEVKSPRATRTDQLHDNIPGKSADRGNGGPESSWRLRHSLITTRKQKLDFPIGVQSLSSMELGRPSQLQNVV